MKRLDTREISEQNGERSPKKFTWQTAGMLLLLVLVTAVIFCFYRVMLRFPYFQYVMYGYMAVAAALILTYVIYNRGFSRKSITADMLPPEWSEEQREEYVADGKRRLHRSRWLLIPILAFVFTFGYEAIELFVVPFFREILQK